MYNALFIIIIIVIIMSIKNTNEKQHAIISLFTFLKNAFYHIALFCALFIIIIVIIIIIMNMKTQIEKCRSFPLC